MGTGLTSVRGVGLILVFLTLTGCAAIPDSTPPQAIGGVDMRKSPQAPALPKGMDPLSLVRAFVDASADPEADYAAAKAYLTSDARAQWDSRSSVTIIDDQYNTAPSDNNSEGPNKRTVYVRATRVGRLVDQSFAPESGESNTPIQVERQPDGEWRITALPPGVVISRTRFGEIYRSVRICYVDPQRDVLVPDIRYTVARPAAGIAPSVIDMLLNQPSEPLRGGAVRSAIGPKATPRTNVTENSDGVLVVDLTQIGDQDLHGRQLIAAQILCSLQSAITTRRVKLLVDGAPLLPANPEPSTSDLPIFQADTIPNPDLSGLVVANKQVRYLRDGSPIPGPAGSGEYAVDKAALTNDGAWLAVVNRTASGGSELRIGQFGKPMQAVPLSATDMTRPTWRSGTNDAELWTVVNQNSIVRVVGSAGDVWTPRPVDTGACALPKPITDLRLSRDGLRAAVVAGGRLWMCTVVAKQDSVSIRAPRQLLASKLTNVVSVDWKGADTLMVASIRTTGGPQVSVAQVWVDGSDWTQYSSSNLEPPITAITAAPTKPVVVATASGLWTAQDDREVWRLQNGAIQGPSVPFYPG